MHLSALLRADARRGPEEAPGVMAYEIVTSGLAGRLSGGGWKVEVARKGSLVSDPIRCGDVTLSISLGVSEIVPNFGGLELREGRAVAHLVQRPEDGVVRYVIPLQWGPKAESLEAMVAGGR